MTKKDNAPHWFKFDTDIKNKIDRTSNDESVGRAVRAAAEYLIVKRQPEGLITDIEAFELFVVIKGRIDDAYDDYEQRVKNGKKGGRHSKGVRNQYQPTPTEEGREIEDIEEDTEEDTDSSFSERENSLSSSELIDVHMPPTVDEVESYCRQRSNGINAKRFVGYYASRQWMCGNTPIKDWRPLILVWETTEKNTPKNDENGTGTFETDDFFEAALAKGYKDNTEANEDASHDDSNGKTIPN